MIKHPLFCKAIGELKKTLKKIQFSPKSIFLVACSGGQDSIALLEILNFISKTQEIQVVHINHGLREESKEEENYVKQFCKERNIVCHTKHLHLKKPTSADHARSKRYNAFLDVAHCIGAQHIFLAHTKTDHVETVLMNIIRGCGLRGLEGIKEVSLRECGQSNIQIVRPFLNISREQTYELCNLLKIKFVSDRTNDDDDVLRVNLRKNIFPNFQGLDNSLVSLAKQATDTNILVKSSKVNYFEQLLVGVYKFKQNHVNLQKVLVIDNLREILFNEGVEIQYIKYTIYEEIFDALTVKISKKWNIKPNMLLTISKSGKNIILSVTKNETTKACNLHKNDTFS